MSFLSMETLVWCPLWFKGIFVKITPMMSNRRSVLTTAAILFFMMSSVFLVAFQRPGQLDNSLVDMV